jgi:DNA-binding LytR/AlgR family response regulator
LAGVFTTVIRNQEVQARARRLGALAVLDKPLDVDDLRETVNSCFRRMTEGPAGLSNLPPAEMEAIAMPSTESSGIDHLRHQFE